MNSERMNNDQLENFEQAFTSGMSGCVRTCYCGRVFYDVENHYDWEPGELEALKADTKAKALPYSVGTIIVDEIEYVAECSCWHDQARRIVEWLCMNGHGVALFLTLEKKRKQRLADNSPTVEECELHL